MSTEVLQRTENTEEINRTTRTPRNAKSDKDEAVFMPASLDSRIQSTLTLTEVKNCLMSYPDFRDGIIERRKLRHSALGHAAFLGGIGGVGGIGSNGEADQFEILWKGRKPRSTELRQKGRCIAIQAIKPDALIELYSIGFAVITHCVDSQSAESLLLEASYVQSAESSVTLDGKAVDWAEYKRRKHESSRYCTVVWLPDCDSYRFRFNPSKQSDMHLSVNGAVSFVDEHDVANASWLVSVLLHGTAQMECKSQRMGMRFTSNSSYASHASYASYASQNYTPQTDTSQADMSCAFQNYDECITASCQTHIDDPDTRYSKAEHERTQEIKTRNIRAILNDFLNTLHEEERRLYYMFYRENLAVSKISDDLHQDRWKVYSHIHSINAKMKAAIVRKVLGSEVSRVYKRTTSQVRFEIFDSASRLHRSVKANVKQTIIMAMTANISQYIHEMVSEKFSSLLAEAEGIAANITNKAGSEARQVKVLWGFANKMSKSLAQSISGTFSHETQEAILHKLKMHLMSLPKSGSKTDADWKSCAIFERRVFEGVIRRVRAECNRVQRCEFSQATQNCRTDLRSIRRELQKECISLPLSVQIDALKTEIIKEIFRNSVLRYKRFLVDTVGVNICKRIKGEIRSEVGWRIEQMIERQLEKAA